MLGYYCYAIFKKKKGKKKKHICFGWKFKGCAGISQPRRSAVGFACRRIIWSDCFSCRHIQLVCPPNGNIFIMSNIKVRAEWDKCKTLAVCHALHVSCSCSAFSTHTQKAVLNCCDKLLHKMKNYCSLTWEGHLTQLESITSLISSITPLFFFFFSYVDMFMQQVLATTCLSWSG